MPGKLKMVANGAVLVAFAALFTTAAGTVAIAAPVSGPAARQPVTTQKAFDFSISTYANQVPLKAQNERDGHIAVEVTQKEVRFEVDYGSLSGSFTEIFEFDFPTGNVTYYGDHGGGGFYSLPMYGNTLSEYKAVIKRLQELLVMNEAPADVTKYFADVAVYLNSHDFDSFTNDYHSTQFHWKQDNTVTVQYTALGEREIVTFVEGGSYKWQQTIRTKVPAGSGVATIHFTLPDANGDDSICLNMNLLPVGGTFVNAQTHPDCTPVKN